MANTPVANQDDKANALLEFMQDIHCLNKLQPWTDKINVFNVLKIARTEIRHSNMLAWLLDPNESHGLGSDFLYALITDLSKPHSYEFIDDEFDPIIDTSKALKLLSLDLTDSQVFREWNYLDILIKLPKNHIIAIENKVDSKEGKRKDKSQLDNYSNSLNKNYSKSTKFKLFLTPNGEKPSKKDWKVYTYFDIVSVLEGVYQSRKNRLSDEANLLISNYIEILKNEIMDNQELKNLCNEIYKEHKAALDLIFDNIDNVISMASDICYSELQNYHDDIKELKSGRRVKFATPKTQKLKEGLERYGIDELYYEIDIKKNQDFGVKLRLILYVHNSTKKYNADAANIINQISEKNKISKDWEWKRIWTSKNKTFEEIDDKKIEEWIKSVLREKDKYEQSKGL